MPHLLGVCRPNLLFQNLALKKGFDLCQGMGSLNPGIPGVDDTVYAATWDDAGNLYVGGDFTVAGTVVANRVAKWDGTNWTALGSGMNGTVRALAAADRSIYAGGRAASYIAKWDGSSWSALGSAVDIGCVRQ